MDDFSIEILALQLPCKIKIFGIHNQMHVINYQTIKVLFKVAQNGCIVEIQTDF